MCLRGNRTLRSSCPNDGEHLTFWKKINKAGPVLVSTSAAKTEDAAKPKVPRANLEILGVRLIFRSLIFLLFREKYPSGQLIA
jgi:hypothetical protein